MQRMRFACWIPTATDTHSEYVALLAFIRHQWSRERALMLRFIVHGVSCISMYVCSTKSALRLPLKNMLKLSLVLRALNFFYSFVNYNGCNDCCFITLLYVTTLLHYHGALIDVFRFHRTLRNAAVNFVTSIGSCVCLSVCPFPQRKPWPLLDEFSLNLIMENICKEPTWCNLAVCLLVTAIILYMFRTLFASILRST
jgi:hypothetical protein